MTRHLHFDVCVDMEWEAFELGANEILLPGRHKSYDAHLGNWKREEKKSVSFQLLRHTTHDDDSIQFYLILAAVFIQELSIPFIHGQVAIQILKDDDSIFALVAICQDGKRFSHYFYFVPIFFYLKKIKDHERFTSRTMNGEAQLLLESIVDKELGNVPP